MLCQLLVLQDALSALLTHERKVTSLILNAVKKLSKNKDLTEFTKYVFPMQYQPCKSVNSSFYQSIVSNCFFWTLQFAGVVMSLLPNPEKIVKTKF